MGNQIYEDELPADMSDADYKAWFAASSVDGVRVGPRLEGERMIKPAPEQMCADLARAMFPTAVIEPSSSGNGVNIRIYDKPNETRSWYDFNPFESADDSRTLVMWIATQSQDFWMSFLDYFFTASGVNYGTWQATLMRVAMTAPLPVIAESAWKAITASSTAAQASAEHSAGQALIPDHLPTTSSGTANQAPSE